MPSRSGNPSRGTRLLPLAALLAASFLPHDGQAQSVGTRGSYVPATAGVRDAKLGALDIRVLIDSTTLGGREMELAEITFPPAAGSRGGTHTHGHVEVLYILSGEMDHVVNGVAHHLVPGMVGIVRPGDEVVHRVTSAEPVRALVIWAPGGELARILR